MPSLKEAALSLAARGFKVFPCLAWDEPSEHDGKCGKAPKNHNGLHGATNDPGIIEAWWDKWPNANIGIATGSSKLCVVDMDGALSWQQVEGSGLELPETLAVTTGRPQSKHLYYSDPKGVSYNQQHIFDREAPGGVDIRGVGGYVVAPPSRHESGVYYEFDDPDFPIAPMPDWLVKYFTDKKNSTVPQAEARKIDPARMEEGSGRNSYLSGKVFKWRNMGHDETQMLALARAENVKFKEPLGDAEVSGIVERKKKAVKAAKEEEDYSGSAVASSRAKEGEPRIAVRDDRLDLLLDESRAALVPYNKTPTLFRFGGGLADVGRNEEGQPFARAIGLPLLREHLSRSAYWFKNVERGKGEDKEWVEVPTKPPMDITLGILANPPSHLPALERVSRCPMFAPSGRLTTSDGYDPELRCWLSLGAGGVPSVPEKPTRDDVAQAKMLLLDDILVDFKFVADADRANACGLYLLPFVRAIIDGATPLHLIEKPSAGSGGSYLARVLGVLAIGADPTFITEGTEEEEWRKRITSTLLGTPEFVVIDNLSRKLASPSLASALTSAVWNDRRLGASSNVSIPIKNVWVATGNNPTVSAEIARRCVSIRIDPKTDKPSERNDFKRTDLIGWVKQNRPKLLWACLVLVRAWFVAGKPMGGVVIGSYDEWAKVVGGILLNSGITGFLDNRSRFQERADQETAAWRDFIGMWFNLHGRQSKTCTDLLPLALENEPCYLGEGKEDGQKKRLGKALNAILDRIFHVEGRMLRVALGTKIAGRQTYHLDIEGAPAITETDWIESQADNAK